MLSKSSRSVTIWSCEAQSASDSCGAGSKLSRSSL
jgi:hypothetical protein